MKYEIKSRWSGQVLVEVEAETRRRRERRRPITVDPNKLLDDPQFSRDEWYWNQVEAKE